MKKLLITTDCFIPRWDGITRFLVELLPELKKEFEVKIIAPNFGDIPKKYNIVQINTSNKTFGDIKFANFDKKKIRKEVKKTDIIFNQSIGPIGFLTILSAKKYNKKVISFIHSIEWELSSNALKNTFSKILSRFIVKKIGRRLYNKVSMLILPSKNLADKLEWNGYFTKKKIVHLGVDTNKFKPVLSKETAKRKLGLEGKFVIGYHGRLAREKDLITLLRSFKRLKMKNVRLLIVGDGLEELKKTLTKKNIILTGQQNNVIKYLNAMDVYVMPSLTETSCLAVMEAMSCGLPVISTPVGFVQDYIKAGKNGLFFPFGNSYSLYKQITFLRNDYSLREKMGLSARRTIIERFQLKRSNKQIIDILKKI